MKKIECILRPFRIQSLVHSLAGHRPKITGLWWQDVRGLAESNLVEKSSGTQFETAMMAMVHLFILVPDSHLDDILGIIREGYEGNGYEDELLVVSDLPNARISEFNEQSQ